MSAQHSKGHRGIAVFVARNLAGIALTFTLASAAYGASAWTDRREYNEVLAIRSEAAPLKRLDLLNQWRKDYPKSALAQARNQLFLSTYQSLGDPAKMLDSALAMLAAQPDNPVGLYWCTVLVPLASNPRPEVLEIGAQASRKILAGLDALFADSKRPPSVLSAAWEKQKVSTELLAHRALGWIEWQRSNYPEAEKELTAGLRKDPANAELAAWLGIVLSLQKEKVVPAVWQFSRAGSLRQAGALPDDRRLQFNGLAESVYVSYHGAPDGLDQIRAKAAQEPFAPADLAVESAGVIAARRMDEEMERTNPQLFAWVKIKRELLRTDTLPAGPLPKLKGMVISCTPANRPAQVVLGLTNAVNEEVTLKLSTPLKNDAEPGTEIEFDEGTAAAFQREPFNLTIQVEPAKITGWPAKGFTARPR